MGFLTSSSSESFPNTDGFCKTRCNGCVFFGKRSPYLHIFFEIEITPLSLNVKTTNLLLLPDEFPKLKHNHTTYEHITDLLFCSDLKILMYHDFIINICLPGPNSNIVFTMEEK